MSKAYAAELGSGNPVRMLADLDIAGSSRTRQLMASANGLLYKTSSGNFTQVSSSLTMASDRRVRAQQRLQKLYIADTSADVTSGTDGVVSSSVFTSASVGSWVTAGVDTDDHMLVIDEGGSGATTGVYQISSISGGGNVDLNLTTAPGNATGVTSHIVRVPKYYDPSDDSLKKWVATAGGVPPDCNIIVLWRDRIVMAGDPRNPQVWFMSKQADPLNWNYGVVDDPQGAVSANNTTAGLIGEPITAIIPHGDDCLLFFGQHTSWVLRGDPRLRSAELDNLSKEVGCIGPDAYCRTPRGETFFLTLDGMYYMGAGCGTTPQSVSREVIPQELLEIDTSSVTVTMEYDLIDRGIHIFLSNDDESAATHWWYDLDAPGFWKVTLQTDHEPQSLFRYTALEGSGTVLLGGRDGYVREFGAANQQDDGGNEISSYVLIGPINAGDIMGKESIVHSMQAVLDESSGTVKCDLQVAQTAEASASAAAFDTYEWFRGGLNATDLPHARCGAFCLKLYNGTTNQRWMLESISMRIKEAGRRRID